jgi:hypothetical protein
MRPQSESNWRLLPADYAVFTCVVNMNIFQRKVREDAKNAKKNELLTAEARRRREKTDYVSDYS